MIHTNYDSIIQKLLIAHSLEPKSLAQLFDAIEQGDESAQNIFEIYLLIKKKQGIKDLEIELMIKILLERARRLRIRQTFLDVCGTGGDGSNSFNISTATAFVLASGGVPVLKHGNRAVSSRCGSSDLMEALGISLEKAAKQAPSTLRKYNFGYLHAPIFHPLLAKIAKVRRRIGEPTIMNYLGPLLHPALPKMQLAGIGDADIFKRYGRWIANAGRTRALVLRSRDGLDEAVPYGLTDFIEIKQGKLRRGTIRAKDFGFRARSCADLRVRSAGDNISIFRRVLNGRERGAKSEAVVLNAGLGFCVSGRAKYLREGIAMARSVIESGAPEKLIANLRKTLKA